MFARTPLSTVAMLLLSSLGWGCRPLLLHVPTDLASPAEDGENKAEDNETGSERNAEAGSTVAPPAALGQGEWILRVAPLGDQLEPGALRWRNVPLEELLAQPKATQPDFTQWLKYKSSSVAGNAAIAAARLLADDSGPSPSDHVAPAGDEEQAETADDDRQHLVVETLVKTARAGELKLAQRRAAIEALGRMPGEAARQALFELVDQYGDFAGPNRNVYSSDLHIELLAALAQQPDDQSLARFVTAIACRAVEVRLAAVQNWPRGKDAVLPEELLELAQDPDPRVRCACLKLLAQAHHGKAFLMAQRAINDLRYEVRLAAVEALESIAGDDAREELIRISKHPAEGLRAAAVKALARREAWEPALLAVDDEGWQVRLALADELARLSTPAAAKVAEKLLADRSTAVQQKMVESLGQWPWPSGGTFLLTALDSNVYQTRETAAKVLSKHWAPAATFPYQGNSEARVAALAELEEKWQTEFPDDPPAESTVASAPMDPQPSPADHPITTAVKQQVAADLQVLGSEQSGDAAKAAARTRLADLADGLPAVLLAMITKQKTTIPEEVYLEVLPALNPEFKLLAKLATADVAGRRQAVSDLREHAAKSSLSELALLRLVDLVVAENDSLVWHEVQQMLEADMREPVVRLQYAGLNHPTAEVQRRACVYLGRHGDARHAVVLSSALADENPLVVRAAAEALGQLQHIDNTLPLVRLLASRDRELVLIVASSLARQGEECGGDGLDRMALDVDPNLRRRAIEMMSELKQARFVPSLIRALDDQLGIKQTALNALAATVGQDIGQGDDETKPPMAEQIYRWQQWYGKQEQARLRIRR